MNGSEDAGAGTVVVVGSVNWDLVVRLERLPEPGETVTGGIFERHPGGKGANQAVAAARAGSSVRFVGAVGDDDLGEPARADLAAEGIDVTDLREIESKATGVALIAVDARGDNQIAVAPGANAAVDAELVHAAFARRPLPAGAVLLMNCEVGDSALEAAAEVAATAGVRIVVDPAPAKPLPARLLGAGPLLTPNAGEATRLTGEADPEAAAHALAARTGAAVVVTLGAEGVIVLAEGRIDRVRAPAAEVVDTTGAGDAFAGVLAARLAAGDPLQAAVEAAVAAASKSVEEPGARGRRPASSGTLDP